MSKFDKNLKGGDVITAYHAGYHRVTKVERRFYTKEDEERYGGRYKAGEEFNALIEYETLADAKGKLRKKPGKPRHCDAAYYSLVSKERAEREYQEAVDAAGVIKQTVLNILDAANEN